MSWSVVLLTAGCSRDVDPPTNDAGVMKGSDAAADAESSGDSSASGDDGNDGAGTLPPTATADVTLAAPISDLGHRGAGDCMAATLGDVIKAVHRKWPALADITQLYQGERNRIGEGRFVYAFAQDNGFALVFQRSGECPPCNDDEYWYFVTDAACAPALVGRYTINRATGDCAPTSGKALWGIPNPDPASICGADNRPVQVSGVYDLVGTGTRVACTEKAGDEPSMNVSLPLAMTVAQTPGDLSRGTVTLTGTGHASIDGQAIPATFTRQRFTAMTRMSNVPAMCIDEHTIDIAYDFEGFAPGRLEFFEARPLGCPPSTMYCKGTIRLELKRR